MQALDATDAVGEVGGFISPRFLNTPSHRIAWLTGVVSMPIVLPQVRLRHQHLSEELHSIPGGQAPPIFCWTSPGHIESPHQ
jgi:hypothetical protein